MRKCLCDRRFESLLSARLSQGDDCERPVLAMAAEIHQRCADFGHSDAARERHMGAGGDRNCVLVKSLPVETDASQTRTHIHCDSVASLVTRQMEFAT